MKKLLLASALIAALIVVGASAHLDPQDSVQDTVVLLANFQHDTSTPITTADAESVMSDVADYYAEISQETTSIKANAYGWYTLSQDKGCPPDHQAAVALADPDVDFTGIDLLVLAFVSRCGNCGNYTQETINTDEGTMDVDVVWISDPVRCFTRTELAHEIAHAFTVKGEGHALDCDTDKISADLGDCSVLSRAYDAYTLMGSGGSCTPFLSSSERWQLDWIRRDVTKVFGSGTYVIRSYERTHEAIRITREPPEEGSVYHGPSYWIEWREQTSYDACLDETVCRFYDSNVFDGYLVHLWPMHTGGDYTALLDCTPESWESEHPDFCDPACESSEDVWEHTLSTFQLNTIGSDYMSFDITVDESDSDADGWSRIEEVHIGTDPADDCPDDSGDKAWPPDLNNDGRANVLDVNLFKPHLASFEGDDNYWPRSDIAADYAIDVLDIMALKPYLSTSCG